MQRFDEQFMLKEANRKMRLNEHRAAVDHALREARRSQPSIRQRLALTLIRLGEHLDVDSYAASRERGSLVQGRRFRP